MTMIDMCRTMIEYNHAHNRRLWDSIFELTDEQFTTELSHSQGSVRDQMVHLVGVDGRWLRGLQGAPDALHFKPVPEDYPTRQSAYDLWKPVAKKLRKYARKLEKNNLKRNPPGMPGPSWQVVLHIANHGTEHRAQVLRMLSELGVTTFDQDLITHLWQY